MCLSADCRLKLANERAKISAVILKNLIDVSIKIFLGLADQMQPCLITYMYIIDGGRMHDSHTKWQPSANRLTETQPGFTAYIFDIGRPC